MKPVLSDGCVFGIAENQQLEIQLKQQPLYYYFFI